MASVTIGRGSRDILLNANLPASKSISNRLLMIRALSDFCFSIGNLSAAEDTLLMQDLLAKIRYCTCIPDATGVIPDSDSQVPVVLDPGNAGTVMRFLTAFLAVTPGTWVLQGRDRMRERPIGSLVEALRTLGAAIEYEGVPGYPPLRIMGRSLNGGEVAVDCSVSSQFASALLMIAPVLTNGLTIHLTGRPVSLPYLMMTVRLMEACGIRIVYNGQTVVVGPGKYRAPAPDSRKGNHISKGMISYQVEGDWSAAAFWYEVAAFASTAVIRLDGLTPGSLQGDAVVADLFRQFGVETVSGGKGIVISRGVREGKKSLNFDLADYPDLAPALIVTCSALGIPAIFTGLENLHTKESDRLRALEEELTKLGRQVAVTASGIFQVADTSGMHSVPDNETPLITGSHGDHRIAMALAPLALLTGTMRIDGSQVVAKSYPGFWEDMKRAGFTILEQG